MRTKLWTPDENVLYLPDRLADPDQPLKVDFHVVAYDHVQKKVVWDERGHNLIVNKGKTRMLTQLAGTTTAPFTSMGVGTDSTAAAATQTQLNPSVAGSVSLIACDATFPSVTADGTTPVIGTWQATWGTGVANFSWNEWAIFNGTTNGTSIMFDRSVFGAFNKTSAVSIILSAAITQS